MSSSWDVAPKGCHGRFSAGNADAYREDTWANRFKPDISDAYLDYCADHPQPPANLNAGNEGLKPVKRIAQWQKRTDDVIKVLPTILLFGMYGAVAFSLLSIGAAWIGFLIVALPLFGIAAWAFTGPIKG
jgi:hypothetical protein